MWSGYRLGQSRKEGSASVADMIANHLTCQAGCGKTNSAQQKISTALKDTT
jgi:hypothetical protein